MSKDSAMKGGIELLPWGLSVINLKSDLFGGGLLDSTILENRARLEGKPIHGGITRFIDQAE